MRTADKKSRGLPGEYGTQLSDSVQVIGACCCRDSALAAAMLFPTQSLAYMESGGNPTGLHQTSQIPGLYASLCSDPLSNLLVLDDSTIAGLALPQASAFLSAYLARVPPILRSCSSPVTRLVSYHDEPIRLLSWRLEAPSRVVLYTGAVVPPPSQLDTAVFQPHTLQKVLVDERSKRGGVTAIHELPASVSATASEDIRDSLSHYAGTRLTPFQETLSSSVGKGVRVQSHTLEEAMACLIHPPRDDRHTQIPLNASVAWTGHHIDSRCAP